MRTNDQAEPGGWRQEPPGQEPEPLHAAGHHRQDDHEEEPDTVRVGHVDVPEALQHMLQLPQFS